MTAPTPSRRSFLSYATGSGVAVGALVALGALGRSCAPNKTLISAMDLSDMEDGELRFYSMGTDRIFIKRTGNALTVLTGDCPVDPPFGWIQPDTFSDRDPLYCPRCTSRFDRDGKITQFWSDRTPPDTAPNLERTDLRTDGLTLLITEYQPIPILREANL